MKETLQQIAGYTLPTQRVVLEAAHIYTDGTPGIDQQAGAIWAKGIIEILPQPIHKVLFIDDVHPDNHTLNIEAYKNWLAEQGYPIDETVLESTLKPNAHQLLSKVRQIVPKKKFAQSKEIRGSEGLWTNTGKVPLLVAGEPSCCLLDASLYLKKFEVGDACITVLPFNGIQKYVEQQSQTLALLRKVKPEFLVINLFFNPENFRNETTLMVNGEIK